MGLKPDATARLEASCHKSEMYTANQHGQNVDRLNTSSIEMAP